MAKRDNYKTAAQYLFELQNKGGNSNATPSSSSSAVSMSTPVAVPFGAGFNDVMGPNTVDKLKSSSMSPSVQPPPPTTQPTVASQQTVPVTDTPSTLTDATPNVTKQPPLEKYIDPNSVAEDSDKITLKDQELTDNYPQQQQQAQTEPQQPTRPKNDRRSVLSWLLDWNDIPYGQKWNHYVQHGPMGMHGNRFDEVMQLAKSENALANTEAALANSNKQSSGSYGQELRARAMERNSKLSQWKGLLDDWRQGRYSSADKYTTQEFFSRAQKLRDAYATAGFNPDELTPPALNAGGFQQGYQRDLQRSREGAQWAGEWMASIQKNVAKYGEKWLEGQEAMLMFDKLNEYAIRGLAKDKGVIADAEKIRQQVALMDVADRKVYDTFMTKFFKASFISQVIALADKGDHDAKATLDHLGDFLKIGERGKKGDYGTIDKDGNIILSDNSEHIINAAMAAYNKVLAKMPNLPIDVDAAVASHKNAKDAFQQYVLQNSNVDRKSVWNIAHTLYEMNKNVYNQNLPTLGLNFGWGFKGPVIDEGLGDYLGKWQETKQPVNEVMKNAVLGSRKIPTVVDDPTVARAGAGGLAKNKQVVERPSEIPKEATNVTQIAPGKFRWKVKGKWYKNY